MKTTLDQLTVAEFLDALCGDIKVLLGKHEIVAPEKLREAFLAILFEYKSIADEAGMKGYLSQESNQYKSKGEVLMLKMCDNLIRLKQYDSVREILSEFGLKVDTFTDQRLANEVAGRLARSLAVINRQPEEKHSEDQLVDVRQEFNRQTAALMAHFKFQIDPATMKASIYAHLVHRHNEEIKAQMAALKK